MKIRFFILLVIIVIVGYMGNFPHGFIFNSGDFTQFIRESYALKLHQYSIMELQTGQENISFIYFIYYLLFFKLQEIVNVNNILFFYITIPLFLTILSIKFSLSKYNIKKYAFIYAFIYAFNIFIYTVYVIPSPFMYIYILIPLIFAYSHSYLSSIGYLNKDFFILLVVFLLSNIAWGNIPFLSAIILILGFYLAIEIIISKDIKLFLKYIVIFFTLFITSIVSVIPQLPILLNQLANFDNKNSVFDLGGWIIWQSLDMVNVWFINENISNYINTFGTSAVLTILFFVILFFVLVYNKISKQNIVILLTIVFTIFLLNKGKGFLSTDIVSHIFLSNPITSSIRSVQKTLVFLPFLVLLLIAINLQKLSIKKQYFVITIMLLTIVPLYEPVFKGKLYTNYVGIEKGKNYLTSKYAYLVKIPNDYYKFANILNRDTEEGRILSIPYSVVNSVGWSNFPMWKNIGCDPTRQLFNKPIVEMNAYNIFGTWNYGSIWNNQHPEESLWLLKFAGLMNVKYFIYHKDTEKYFYEQTIDKIQFYEKHNYIKKIFSSKFFDGFKLNSKFVLPFMYIPKKIIYDKRTTDTPLILQEKYNFKEIAIVNNNFKNIEFDSKATISYKKLSPSKYKVKISNIHNSTIFVFSNTFSNNWKVYPMINSYNSKDEFYETFFKKYLDEDNHFKVNGFANAWYIDKKLISKNNDVELIIEHYPQKLIYITRILLIIFLFVILILYTLKYKK